jgi:hypothetical protein
MFGASAKLAIISGSLGIVSDGRVPGLTAKAINLFFRRRAVQPLKRIFARRAMTPKHLLQTRLELQFKSNRAPANEFARTRKFPRAPLHVVQCIIHHTLHNQFRRKSSQEERSIKPDAPSNLAIEV